MTGYKNLGHKQSSRNKAHTVTHFFDHRDDLGHEAMQGIGASMGHPHIHETDTGSDMAAYHLSTHPLTKAHRAKLDKYARGEED